MAHDSYQGYIATECKAGIPWQLWETGPFTHRNTRAMCELFLIANRRQQQERRLPSRGDLIILPSSQTTCCVAMIRSRSMIDRGPSGYSSFRPRNDSAHLESER